jgi:hypothetical protein
MALARDFVLLAFFHLLWRFLQSFYLPTGCQIGI